MAQEFSRTLALNHALLEKINHIRSERNVFNQLYQRVVHELQVCKKLKGDMLQSAGQAVELRYNHHIGTGGEFFRLLQSGIDQLFS